RTWLEAWRGFAVQENGLAADFQEDGCRLAHPWTCISPVIAGEQMSFSHMRRLDVPAGMPSSASLAALRERIRYIEQPLRHGLLPFGVAAIDDALPGS